MGTYVLSAGYYEAYYNKAQKVRRLLVQSISDLFKQVDYIINPVTPNKPWKIGENLDDPIKVYLSDVLTVYVNLVGLPSLSLPWSKDELNLPIGMQITGPRKKDFNLLSSCQEIGTP
jgi:aspartyl-tRNA(Asn)/glutamyl-tRNA(Gln) amidotransferase subunit A